MAGPSPGTNNRRTGSSSSAAAAADKAASHLARFLMDLINIGLSLREKREEDDGVGDARSDVTNDLWDNKILEMTD